VKCL